MGCVQKTQLAASNFDQVGGKTLAKDAIKDVFCKRILETPNHDALYQYMIHLSIVLYHKMIQIKSCYRCCAWARWANQMPVRSPAAVTSLQKACKSFHTPKSACP